MDNNKSLSSPLSNLYKVLSLAGCICLNAAPPSPSSLYCYTVNNARPLCCVLLLRHHREAAWSSVNREPRITNPGGGVTTVKETALCTPARILPTSTCNTYIKQTMPVAVSAHANGGWQLRVETSGLEKTQIMQLLFFAHDRIKQLSFSVFLETRNWVRLQLYVFYPLWVQQQEYSPCIFHWEHAITQSCLVLVLHKQSLRCNGTKQREYRRLSSSGPTFLTIMEVRVWAHQCRVPRGLLLVPRGNPLHTDHFPKQILILPLVALLLFAGGWGQLFFLTAGDTEEPLSYFKSLQLKSWTTFFFLNNCMFVHKRASVGSLG